MGTGKVWLILIYCAAIVIGQASVPPNSPAIWSDFHNSKTITLNAHNPKNVFVFDFPNYIQPPSSIKKLQRLFGCHSVRNLCPDLPSQFITYDRDIVHLPRFPRLFENRIRCEHIGRDIAPASNNSQCFPVISETILNPGAWKQRWTFEKPTVARDVRQNIGSFGIISAIHKLASSSPQFFRITNQESSNDGEGGSCYSKYSSKDIQYKFIERFVFFVLGLTLGFIFAFSSVEAQLVF